MAIGASTRFEKLSYGVATQKSVKVDYWIERKIEENKYLKLQAYLLTTSKEKL